MAVASKFLDTAIDRYEKLGLSKHKLSAAAAGVVALAYAAHLTYPHLSKWMSGNETIGKHRDACTSPNTSSSSASDDEDFDSDTDDYELTTIVDGIDHMANDIDANDKQSTNNNNTHDGHRKLIGHNEICENGLMPMVKRKKKHAKVIKQQIKQAEKLLAAANKQDDGTAIDHPTKLAAAKRIGLNVQFLFQLKRLIEIMIPKLWCRETTILGVHTMCLLSRTFLSFYVASVEGSIVKYIVRKDFRQFLIGLLKWFGIAIPATFINSMIRYLENKLALSFR